MIRTNGLCPLGKGAYKRAAEPKELVLIRVGHVDQYDRVNLIPFGKLTDVFKANLK